MKLVSRVLIIIFFLISCELENVKNISENIVTKKIESQKENELNEIKDKKETVLQPKKEAVILSKKETVLYLLEEPYFIEGVKYIPEEVKRSIPSPSTILKIWLVPVVLRSESKH